MKNKGIAIGVDIKSCKECDRGDCSQCGYKAEFERLMRLPNCNDCGRSQYNSCGFCRKIGETVRINCPLWEPREAKE